MLKVKDAAAKVGLSVSQMNKMRCYGTGPVFYKLGAAVFYKPEDLDTWIADKRRISTWAVNDNAARGAKVA